MRSTIDIALSGLRAAETRLANSANNVANAQSTHSIKDGVSVKEPYAPTRVQQTSLAEGGVAVNIVKDSAPYIAAYDPENADANENGFVNYPNVDIEKEVVERITATYDFKANLKVIQADKSIFQKLLDIFG